MKKIDTKYAHLKFEIIECSYKYVLLEGSRTFVNVVNQLASECTALPFFLFSSQDEFSAIIPANFEVKSIIDKDIHGWTCFRIVGDMPFGTVQGLISNVSSALKEVDVGVCVASSYKSDFFFIKKDNLDKARTALQNQGWQFL